MRLNLLKLWEIKKCFIYEWLAASQLNRVRSDSEVWFLGAQTHMEIIVLYELLMHPRTERERARDGERERESRLYDPQRLKVNQM